VTNPERALQRRNTVLAQMVKHQKLPEDKVAALKKKPLKIDFERQEPELGEMPHLAQQLRRWLIEWADRNDYNIYADGLVVRTTIDSRLQAMATKALVAQGDRLQKIVAGDWRFNSGWKAKSGAQRELALAFVRDTPEYKAARAAGQTDEQALKALLANADFMQALKDDKTRCRRASWRWTRATARCGPGSAAAILRTTSSTTCNRRAPAGLDLQAICVRCGV
jgi:penicillin-binding protein 1A